ncbi:cupin domain-containing protein [Nocardioides sp. NPDC087217]|uniref:AraC family transcriptional regulator n=1 Tax=Nocardioides sp. NPDC087217 TaxID=3364335 RepID=UPI0038167762
MDPLADTLTISGVRGALTTRIEAGGEWALSVEGHDTPSLHAVTAGRAWLSTPDISPVELASGDVVLLPASTPYRLASEPSGRTGLRLAHQTQSPGTIGVVLRDPVRLGSMPASTRIATIKYHSDPITLTQILSALPSLVHVRADSATAGLNDAVRMLARESTSPGIGSTAVLRSLVDIVLVEMLRAWLAENPPECFGTWLGALGDPVVGKALQYLHKDPAMPWTTDSLAEAISVSRATLARRFPSATGLTPAAYLTQWRMDLAAVRLRDTHDPVELIAANVGYGSVPAFSRAFARAHGLPPGRYRARKRDR